MVKERDFVLDSFRGVLIWCVVFFHFVRVGGHFGKESLSGVVYLCVCIFIMEAFLFITGYFAKNPARSKETAFKTFLMPYLILIPVSFLFRDWYFGNANLNYFTPPFALWFLFVAFFYRYFLQELLRVKHLFIIAVVFYLISGCFDFLGSYMALGRAVNYFPYFLLGYYCQKEHIQKVRSIKKWKIAILGAGLVGACTALALFAPVPIGWYLLRDPASVYGLTWYVDILMKFITPFISIGWIVFIINVIPEKKTYLSYVGMNTISIYVLHIFIRYVLKNNGVPIDNQVLYVLAMFAGASLVVVILSLPPVSKTYNKIFDMIYDGYVKLKHLLLIYPEDKKK